LFIQVGCGEWNRPMMPNPAYKGKWKPPRIKNPAYKGPWVPRQIPNPEHYEDKKPMNSLAPMAALAVEVWTTNAGIHYDNFAIAHTLKDAWRFADATYSVKTALETKRADVEKREEERKKAKKQRAAKLKKKGDWRGHLEARAEELSELVQDHAFYALTAAAATVLLVALTAIGVVNNRSANKRALAAVATAAAGAGAAPVSAAAAAAAAPSPATHGAVAAAPSAAPARGGARTKAGAAAAEPAPAPARAPTGRTRRPPAAK